MSGAKRVGVVASECYFPSTFVSQAALEEFDGVSPGKYTAGLGQTRMAFTGAGEDINSMMLSALTNLMEKYNLSYSDIGRLEVGTETILDKSKSSKTALMPLFAESGNTDVLGVTNKNACYGGTAALFNTIDWVESSAWDGRYGVVLAGDIAVYERGPARPTGGAGVVALLVGPEAPLVLENQLRASHFEDAYDFYKPDHASEYPFVDGPLSNSCYLRAVDKCYQSFCAKFERHTGEKFSVFGSAPGAADRFLFHQPYAKLVQKSFGRLLYNDLLRGAVDDAALAEIAEQFAGLSDADSYTNRDLDKACVTATKAAYEERVFPYTHAGRNLGNSYTGSLYFGLLSLIAASDKTDLANERVLMFSYGSGLAATMFSLRVDGDLTEQRETCNLLNRLEDRHEASPEVFTDALSERAEFHSSMGFEVRDTPTKLAPGAFHLAAVDTLGRRSYARSSSAMVTAALSRGIHYHSGAVRAGKLAQGVARRILRR